MTTAQQIATAALEDIGVADPASTPSAGDSVLCLRRLNRIIDSWSTQRLYAHSTIDVSATLNGSSLTIGASQDLDTPRPVRLEPGCYITVGEVDYPLEVLTEAQYNGIHMKSVDAGWPRYCFYDAASPTGTVYFWPAGSGVVHLMVKAQVSQFANLTTDYTLTPGVELALVMTLAESIAPVFERKLPLEYMRAAANARRVMRRANVEVPQLNSRGFSIEISIATSAHDSSVDGGTP
jgi:hypothetical protein